MDQRAVLEALGRASTVKEAAANLGVSERHLRRFAAQNRLPSPSTYLGRRLEQPAVRKVLVIPDNHIPYHDPAAIELQLRCIEVAAPDVVVIIGDYIDNYDLSDFTRNPERKLAFRDELDAANWELDRLVAASHNAEILYFMGNHEARLERYIAKRAPELGGLVQLDKLLRLEERGIRSIPYGESHAIGRIHFSHEFGYAGKNAPQQSLAGTGHCCVFGHSHAAGVAYGGFSTGERHVAMACGWGGDYESLAFSYKRKAAAKREWVHGIGWCEIEVDSGLGWVTFVPFLNHSARFAGHYVTL